MLGVGAEDSMIWDLLGIFLPKLFSSVQVRGAGPQGSEIQGLSLR